MWKGVIPATTTQFKEDGALDREANVRTFSRQIDAGCDGLIIGGSLGEGPMLTMDERLELIALARQVAGKRLVLLSINEATTAAAAEQAKIAAKAGVDGILLVPSAIYHTDRRETVATMRAVAAAGDLPIMIYSNPVAYRVDVTPDTLEDLAVDSHFVAIKESCNDIRRTTEILARFGNRFDVFGGVDNLAYETLTAGGVGWVAGLSNAFPAETVAIYRLIMAGRFTEALVLYRWFRPLLDLDVSTYLVQNIKLVETVAAHTHDYVRPPRLPHSGETRARIEHLVRESIATRPELPAVA